MTYFAHSGVPEKNISPQTYFEHIDNTCQCALKNSQRLFKNQMFVDAVTIAALYHDIGKLHQESQDVLSGTLFKEHLLNHVDAGVAYLLDRYLSTSNITYLISAWIVHAHHKGLQDADKLFQVTSQVSFTGVKKTIQIVQDALRDMKIINITDTEISGYLAISNTLLPKWHTYESSIVIGDMSSVNATHLRMMLSCLVDADHSDTSRHYGCPQKQFSIPLDSKKKIQSVDTYISSLKSMGSPQRQNARAILLAANRSITTTEAYHCVDAPVGTGKTLSVLRGALEVAAAKQAERIFTILPFTNVITQTVEAYRKSMGVNEWQVAEIHSKVEFSNYLLRKFNNLWDAPINVSTAVQFFECLWSNHPVALRKLKQFANSVIIIDEFDGAIPHDMWLLALNIMRVLTDEYNTTFIFTSGSSARYWRIFDIDMTVNEVLPTNTYMHLQAEEASRVTKTYLGDMTIDDIVMKVDNSKSTLMVFNTIKNALSVAQQFPDAYFVASCMTPTHRERVLKQIKVDLAAGKNIKVISTSILECGHDISFDEGFREYAGVRSILQVAGRINRGGLTNGSNLYVFCLDDEAATFNPQIRKATNIAKEFDVSALSPEDTTEAVHMEIDHNKASTYARWNRDMMMKQVGNLSVISSNTYTIICDAAIVKRIQRGDKVYPIEINRVSIQVWENKLEQLLEDLVKLDGNRIYGLLDSSRYDATYGVVS